MEDDIHMTEKFGEQDRKETRKLCRKKGTGFCGPSLSNHGKSIMNESS
jgi:hypothetical protein